MPWLYATIFYCASLHKKIPPTILYAKELKKRKFQIELYDKKNIAVSKKLSVYFENNQAKQTVNDLLQKALLTKVLSTNKFKLQ